MTEKPDPFDSAKYFDHDQSAARLTHTEISEAIHDFLDTLEFAEIRALPKTMTIYGFKPMEVSESQMQRWADDAIENMLERFDEEYGDPEGGSEPMKPDDKKALEKLWLETVRATVAKQYVWNCEGCGSREIDITEYIQQTLKEDDNA